ncbi:MAG: hypothetical protein JWN41_1109 [Thermoleophilia bacterium]|nr:hypothetical protein [Thermoleophilia bacterium]
MHDATTIDVAPMPASDAAPGRWRDATWSVIKFSLAITAAAAALAGVVAAVSSVRWALAFVVLRWLIVAGMLATPLAAQLATHFGARWRLPYALRTPATAVLLTCESIAFDIISAHFA